jgi:hypothetical protein
MPVELRANSPFAWSGDAKKYPWIASCHRIDLRCHFYVAASSEENAKVALALHTCPFRGPTKVGLLMSLTLLEEAWEHLDELVDKIMDPMTDPEEKRDLQHQAKGVSRILALFMQPHFNFPHEISAEARNRYKARQEDNKAYETAGLGSRRLEFPADFRKETTSKATRRQPAAKQDRELSEKEKTAIKFASDSGMFSREQLAETYGVSTSTIDKVIS